MKTIDTVDPRPFKKLIMTIGELPTSFLESMTYYEMLAWFVDYLQNTIIPSVNNNAEALRELQTAFVTLKNYVDNYFANLDVQEEINNKLDAMVEAGTLTQLIAQFLSLNAVMSFPSVADMKLAQNLVNGSTVETYGFYNINDGGGAKYLIREITNEDIVDETLIIEITGDPTNTLIAELILEPEMNVKQFGCLGDNTTDDTTKFNIALENCNKLTIPNGTYLIERFLPKVNQTIVGDGTPKLKLTGTTAPLCSFKSNEEIKNLEIVSTKNDLEWNRCEISGISDLKLINCNINGFKHNSPAPNAWGTLINNSTNILISNCYFTDNSQSDIAIVENTKNVTIERCDGSALHINVEPNTIDPIENISIVDTSIDKLDLQENQNLATSSKNISIISCSINTLRYDGSTASIINCEIGNIKPFISSNVGYGGNLNIVNSANFSKNLINDTYLDTLHATGSEWLADYIPSAWSTVVTSSNTENGICVELNKDHTNTTVGIKHSAFDVTEGETYLIRINSNENAVPSGANNISQNLAVKYQDNTSTDVANVTYSINRHASNTESGLGEISAILEVPANATKMIIRLRNSSYGTQSLSIRSVELYKINKNTSTLNNLTTLATRNHRVFYGSAIPTGNSITYGVGDIMYYNDPTTYTGAICTEAGMPGTWRNF